MWRLICQILGCLDKVRLSSCQYVETLQRLCSATLVRFLVGVVDRVASSGNARVTSPWVMALGAGWKKWSVGVRNPNPPRKEANSQGVDKPYAPAARDESRVSNRHVASRKPHGTPLVVTLTSGIFVSTTCVHFQRCLGNNPGESHAVRSAGCHTTVACAPTPHTIR